MLDRSRSFRVLVGSAALALGGGASAQDADLSSYIQDANRSVAAAGQLTDAADILFPVAASMSPPPQRFGLVRQASLLSPASGEWSQFDSWAAASEQQAVIDALIEATDPEERRVLGFPYGRGVDEAWIEAGLFVDLGAPAFLARGATDQAYLRVLTDVVVLATIEAARLAEAGDGTRCKDVLVAWALLGRQVSDRVFFHEKLWGMTQMASAAERLRDIGHEYPELFTPDDIASATNEFDLRNLRLDRIEFPKGERLALEELIVNVIEERGGPTDRFAPVMGVATAGEHAFSAFGRAAEWEDFAEGHAGWFDTKDELEKVFGDWGQRWKLNDPFDALMSEATDFSRMDRSRFAVIERFGSRMEGLFDLRMRVLVEITGTRSALGVLGYKRAQGVWPPSLTAVQPRFVRRLDNDPWNFDRTRNARDVFQFFVPMRDRPRGPRELPKPHVIRVALGLGESALEGERVDVIGPTVFGSNAQTFADAIRAGVPSSVFDPATKQLDVDGMKEFVKSQVRLMDFEAASMERIVGTVDGFGEFEFRAMIDMVDGAGTALSAEQLTGIVGGSSDGDSGSRSLSVTITDEDFVLYSVGPDGRRQTAEEVGVLGSDILMWPPLLSLQREN